MLKFSAARPFCAHRVLCIIFLTRDYFQISGGVTIFLLLVISLFSLLLGLGVVTSIRGLMLPWGVAMCVVIFFQVRK